MLRGRALWTVPLIADARAVMDAIQRAVASP